MRKFASYLAVFSIVSLLIVSCGKETSETLISFNPEDVELNGNAYNIGCLECDIFTWCDNSQFTYVPVVMGTAQAAFTLKYKNVSRRNVGGYEFIGTVVAPGDTVYHNCQNNVTRILTRNRTEILKLVNGDGVEGETWTDTYSGGDTVVTYKITSVDAPVSVFAKTYNSNVTVLEKKYYSNGSSVPTDWTFVEENENIYARDRISSVRVGGIGLLQTTKKNSAGNIIYQKMLKSYILP